MPNVVQPLDDASVGDLCEPAVAAESCGEVDKGFE
jgi:hypothetical protein